MLKFLYLKIRSLFVESTPNPARLHDYYRTKDPGGIDAAAADLRLIPTKGGDPSTIIGFLAQLFRSSPETKRLLRNERSGYARSMYLIALYRADLLDEARTFADRNGLGALLGQLPTDGIGTLATAVPWSHPAVNDLFIGAYMASGDTIFIQRVLENFSTADDVMVSDGIRMGYLMQKWGMRHAPKERESVTLAAARARYPEQAQFIRVLTLMTATWALLALSKQDEGIARTFANFFENDPRLRNLLLIEQTVGGNYLTYLTLFLATNAKEGSTGSGTNARVDKSLSAYERLEPAHDVFPLDDSFTIPGTAAEMKPAPDHPG